MKVLKSGVEVDPKKLMKIKGGTCGCYCEGPGSGSTTSYPATVGDVCVCQCEAETFETPNASANDRIL